MPKGCRVPPAGVWGVPNYLFSSPTPHAAARERRERISRGHPHKRELKGYALARGGAGALSPTENLFQGKGRKWGTGEPEIGARYRLLSCILGKVLWADKGKPLSLRGKGRFYGLARTGASRCPYPFSLLWKMGEQIFCRGESAVAVVRAYAPATAYCNDCLSIRHDPYGSIL